MPARLLLHPTAIPHLDEVQRRTRAVAFPIAQGRLVELVRVRPSASFDDVAQDIARALDVDPTEVRISSCKPKWEDG